MWPHVILRFLLFFFPADLVVLPVQGALFLRGNGIATAMN